MIRYVVLAALVALSSCGTAPAFAAKGHAHHHKHTHHVRPASAPVLPVFWSFLGEQPHAAPRHRRAKPVVQVAGGSSDVVSAARAELGHGAIYGRSNFWCARFMNYVLERTGHKGTGSDLAWSFAAFPHTQMHVGAIAVMRHHVGVVSGVTARGDPILISGNNGRRVREAAYPMSRIAAFVEAR